MIKWEPGERITETYSPVATNTPETNEWEVVSRGRIKVIRCDHHFGGYLEVGEEYNLIAHAPESWLHLWEIPVKATKKPNSSGQVLLYDWNDRPDAMPSFEIDF